MSHHVYPLPLSLLIVAVSGFMMFQQDRIAVVAVRDIETKAPIADAEVRVLNSFEPSVLHNSNLFARTGTEGHAQFSLDASAEFGPEVVVEAKGYQSAKLNISPEDIRKLPPVHWFEKTRPHEADFVLELYAEPAFSVELVLPCAYRGVVKVDVSYVEDIVCPRGMRCFKYAVPNSGEIQLRESAVLRRVLPPSYEAAYADGAKLDANMGINKVGFRWLKQEGSRHYYVVGTQYDYDRFCSEYGVNEPPPANPSQDGKRSGGRGGRRQRSSSTPQLEG